MPFDVTALLKEWGVTIGLISAVATSLLVIFLISFREFALWFVRINQIIKNQDKILEKLNQMELAMGEQIQKPSPSLVAVEERSTATPGETPSVKKERFQIHS